MSLNLIGNMLNRMIVAFEQIFKFSIYLQIRKIQFNRLVSEKRISKKFSLKYICYFNEISRTLVLNYSRKKLVTSISCVPVDRNIVCGSYSQNWLNVTVVTFIFK